MGRIGVGVMHNTINSRFGPKPLVYADYAIGLACGADSFWVADHGPRMMRANGRYADGWFPGTTGAGEYGEQLAIVRAAASDAGRHRRSCGIRYRQGVYTSLPGKDWARHGAQHPLGRTSPVVGNAGAIQPSLRKSAAATTPFVKVLRGLRKL